MDNSKVIWREGMFLAPQHFQQQERYLEHFTRELIKQSQPSGFGFSKLEIDTHLLHVGKLVLSQAQGIFADGTPFKLCAPLICSIPDHAAGKTVVLALACDIHNRAQVGTPLNVDARYQHQTHQVKDISCEQGEDAEVDIGQLNLQLKIDDQALPEYTLLGVAQIKHVSADGEVELARHYIPACLQLGASPLFAQALQAMLDNARHKVKLLTKTLAPHLAPHNKSLPVTEQRLQQGLWLQTLSLWMPKLEQWLADPHFLAKELYFQLVAMTGQFQALNGQEPAVFAPWTVVGQSQLFNAIFSQCKTLLFPDLAVIADLAAAPASIIQSAPAQNISVAQLLGEPTVEQPILAPAPVTKPASSLNFPLVQIRWDRKLFATRRLLRTLLPDPHLLRSGRFILAVSAAMELDQLKRRFSLAAKLAGNSDIAHVVRNRLTGVPLNLLADPPAPLTANDQRLYFEVDTQSALWQAIAAKVEPIALFIEPQIPNVDVACYVMR